MDILSQDFQRAMLESMDRAWEKKLELEREHLATKDLLTQKQVIDEFSLSRNLLVEWEDKGLRRFVPSYEGAKKVYYRKTDIINFLSVG